VEAPVAEVGEVRRGEPVAPARGDATVDGGALASYDTANALVEEDAERLAELLLGEAVGAVVVLISHSTELVPRSRPEASPGRQVFLPRLFQQGRHDGHRPPALQQKQGQKKCPRLRPAPRDPGQPRYHLVSPKKMLKKSETRGPSRSNK
jgi:hypothetical protein